MKQTLFKYLLTTARRDGINNIFIGTFIHLNDLIALYEHNERYSLPWIELNKDEKFDDAISRLVATDFTVLRYVGKFDFDNMRQFNFEVEVKSTINKFVWLKLQDISRIDLAPYTAKLLKNIRKQDQIKR